jgi:hypothetical protein
MANALNRDIKAGDVVVLKQAAAGEGGGYANWRRRLFRVTSGPGMTAAAFCTELYGVFIVDKERARFDGQDIDRALTARLIKHQPCHGIGCFCCGGVGFRLR